MDSSFEIPSCPQDERRSRSHVPIRWAAFLLGTLTLGACTSPPSRPRLVSAPPLPASGVIVDLTPSWPRPFAEGQSIERAGCHVEVDPRSNVAGVPPEQWFGKAVVLDLKVGGASQLAGALDVDDIEDFERTHGEIGTDDRVLLRTGFASHAGGLIDSAATFVDPPIAPGFTLEALRLLVERRGVRVLGSDAPRLTSDRESEAEGRRMLWERSGIVILNLSGLERLPPRGATIVVAPLPRRDNSSAPARVLGVVPR